ncbi:hypothetical protein AM501_07810, partial [Aneurinibacillus migulanus]
MSGLHDYVKYDKEGRITDNRRSASNTSTGVSSGERFVLTNANSSTITVEGAYDAFTVTNRENPALFTYTLAPGASMEATYTGSTNA